MSVVPYSTYAEVDRRNSLAKLEIKDLVNQLGNMDDDWVEGRLYYIISILCGYDRSKQEG